MNKIAFLITVYKKERLDFFKKSINSIINQDYGFENINIYLGIDGELTDELNSYITENQDFFYKTILNDSNKGLAYTLNKLIEVLENELYIFRMDSDDICALNRVSKQVDFLDNNNALIVGSNLIEIDEEGKTIREKKMPIGHKEIIKYSITRNPLNHPTVALKKEFFNKVGNYNEAFLKAQDYELWARALKKHIVLANINEPLLYFRVAKDYLVKRNSVSNYINELKISISLMKYFKKYNQLPIILAKFIFRLMPKSVGAYIYKRDRS